VTIEAKPVGEACNLGCDYCYQQQMRAAGNIATSVDLDAMFGALQAEGVGLRDAHRGGKTGFTVFGGEPLLTPMDTLERLFTFGLEQAGKNSIQTNGTLITDAHVEMFQRYRVSVGISIDGPDELNDVRTAGTIEETRAATARTFEAIDKLIAVGIVPGLIVTLHRGNATTVKRERLKAWFREMDAKGIRSARLHLLEVENADVRAQWQLTTAETIEALIDLADLETSELRALRFHEFRDMTKLLMGQDGPTSEVSCIWNACDPWTTDSVRGISARGVRSNCGRTNKEGVNWQKADRRGYERQLALYLTPQQDGGCAGCRFWIMCKGECPGTAHGGDWRERTEHCGVRKATFGFIEARLLEGGQMPLSMSPARRQIEAVMFQSWERGSNIAIAQAVEAIASGMVPAVVQGDAPHGDAPHGDVPHGDASGVLGYDAPHGDAPHGDAPHGDIAHGDHDDAAAN
jgi:uncharacterized protein